jgi:hypothetical protein
MLFRHCIEQVFGFVELFRLLGRRGSRPLIRATGDQKCEDEKAAAHAENYTLAAAKKKAAPEDGLSSSGFPKDP